MFSGAPGSISHGSNWLLAVDVVSRGPPIERALTLEVSKYIVYRDRIAIVQTIYSNVILVVDITALANICFGTQASFFVHFQG